MQNYRMQLQRDDYDDEDVKIIKISDSDKKEYSERIENVYDYYHECIKQFPV